MLPPVPPKGPTHKVGPIYLIGFLCLIPLMGAFIGLVLLLFGILHYKDKWLILIGAFGIVFTIAVYSGLFYFFKHSDIVKEGNVKASQMQLNGLVKSVEFYKLEHGDYPDNLQQLLKEDPLTPINDALQMAKQKQSNYYNYQKVGSKYLLFSSGPDGIPNTADDLYPQITISDSTKIGWIPSKR